MSAGDFVAAHLEGRIRFYLKALHGMSREFLIECIEEDLRRMEEWRAVQGKVEPEEREMNRKDAKDAKILKL